MSSAELGQYFGRVGIDGSPGTAGALRFAVDHAAARKIANPLRQQDGTTIGQVAADPELVVVRTDIVEIWGHGSFPASDPPANW